MVFFTCSSCGESLKKNAVAKHIQSKCRSAQYVTCMDCSKEFWGEDYTNHTSCITENEKYGGTNFVAKDQKGKKKQEQWMIAINQYVNSTQNSDSELLSLLKKIANYENVPRKENKFKNFLKNCIKVSPKLADKAWDVVHKIMATITNNSNENIKDEKNGVEEKTNVQNEKKHSKINDDNDHGEKNGKKKKKHNKETSDLKDGSQNDEINGVDEESVSKKKKKKHNKQNEEDQPQEIKVEETNVKKRKHKKKNKENGDITLDQKHDVSENMDKTSENVEEKKKKKRKKDEQDFLDNSTSKKTKLENNNEIEIIINGDNSSKKRKKNKDKSMEEKPKKQKLDHVFDWLAIINESLVAVKEGMKLKKLEKFVVQKFLQTGQELNEDEAKRLFRNNINNSNYVITGKIIKMK